MRSITLIAVALATVALIATACKGKSSGAPPETPTTASEPSLDGKFYSLHGAKLELKVGAKTTATLKVKVDKAAGYKWNKEYPAKVEFPEPPQKVGVAKKVYKQTAGDFQTTDEQALVKIGLEGKAAGTEKVAAKVRFSICNDKVCLIKKDTVAIEVTVTP